MDAQRRPVYKEWSPWPGWIQIVFWGALTLGLVAIVESPDLDRSQRTLGSVLLVLAGVLVQVFVGGLSVRLYRDHARVGLGTVGVIHRNVRYEDILETESVHYRPLRDFGGWGLRFRGNRRAWTARGDAAVVLRMADGTELYVGSDRPHRLEERIRTIGGTRIGSRRADGPGTA